MSKDNVKNMFAKFEKDADLKKKYAEIIAGHQKEAEKTLAGKLIELGKNSGFDFSKDDLMQARSELMDKTNANAELADNELTSVAGGGQRKTAGIALSLMSIGILCAIGSIIYENDSKGRCATEMTTSDPNCKNT